MVLFVCFGLSRCCLFGRMFVVTVLSVWAVLGCHGVVYLVGLGYYGMSNIFFISKAT